MKKYLISMLSAAVLLSGCTDLDEIYYSEIAQNTYFGSKDNIYAALARPYTKWRGIQGWNPWMLQEIVTDEFCVTQKGADYESGGIYRQLHWHTWTPEHSTIYQTYFQMGEGISYALAMISELSDLDYSKYGGAVLLGIDKVVVKSHGSSKAESICASVLQAKDAAASGLISSIKELLASSDLEAIGAEG